MKIEFVVFFVLCSLLLCSCGDFIVAVDKADKIDKLPPGGTSETTYGTTETVSDTEEVPSDTEPYTEQPEPVPNEPDPSFFSSVEELLSCPPVEGAKIAFCYEDLTTGISWSYNDGEVMYSASVMKLPYAISILYMDEIKDMGLDGIYTFTGNEDLSGTGEIKNMKPGTTFSYIELIDYLLKYSDNVASGALFRKYERDVYYDYVRSVGADNFTKDWGFAMSAEDCRRVLRSVWEYLEGNYKYSDRIKKVMIESQHKVMLSPGLGGKPIARKYGWDKDAYHDVGIVYDTHPYTIVFMSDMESGDWTINGYISKVAHMTDEIHTELWSGVDTEH